jgi:hypothetical protein
MSVIGGLFSGGPIFVIVVGASLYLFYRWYHPIISLEEESEKEKKTRFYSSKKQDTRRWDKKSFDMPGDKKMLGTRKISTISPSLNHPWDHRQEYWVDGNTNDIDFP